MGSGLNGLVVCVAFALLGGCTTVNNDSNRCVPGASVACTCSSGGQGAQTCSSAGTYEACTCASPSPVSDGSTLPDALGTPQVDVGSPIQNWVGRTFLLDTPAIKSTNWREPMGAGDALSEFVPQLLISIEATTSGGVKVTMATAISGVQDECNPTTDATVSNLNYPEILISASSFAIRVADSDPDRSWNVVASTARNLSLKNVLPGTTTETPTSELIATLDVSELYPLAYRVTQPTPDKVCATFRNEADVQCRACPHDPNKVYCIKVRAVQIAAQESGTPLRKILPAEIPASCGSRDSGT